MNPTERAAVPSTVQTQSLLSFLEKNPSLAKGFSKYPFARNTARKTWQKLAIQLNSLGGCVKTWQQWTKYWADKKNSVRKKSALHFASRHETGCEVMELSEVEERILRLMCGEGSAASDRHLKIMPFTVRAGQTSENAPSLVASTQLIDHNTMPSLPMEVMMVEESEQSEQSESNHGVGSHFTNFQETTDECPIERPISRESNAERPSSRESCSRKRSESNADPFSDSFSNFKRQRRVQNSTVVSNQTKEDLTNSNKERSNVEKTSSAIECDLYGQLLAQKLKPLDVEDRLVLMNNIDNLVFKHLISITKRNKMSRSADLESTVQEDSDIRQSTDRSYSRPNQILNGSQNGMLKSQHEIVVIKADAD